MQQRCDDAGIKSTVWKSGQIPPYDAKIIFTIAESAVSKTFADFINSKKAAHQLERIVIDECHTILQATNDYRPHMKDLYELAGKSVQVVCLTATLPPKKEGLFLAAMDIRMPEAKILREVTTRPNIAYHVQHYVNEEEDEAVQQLVEQKKAQYPRRTRSSCIAGASNRPGISPRC